MQMLWRIAPLISVTYELGCELLTNGSWRNRVFLLTAGAFCPCVRSISPQRLLVGGALGPLAGVTVPSPLWLMLWQVRVQVLVPRL